MGFLFIFFSDHNDHVSPSPSSSPSPATTLFRTRSSRLLLSKAQSTISICIFLLLLILFLFTPSTSEPSSGFSAVSPRRFLLNCNVTVTRRRSNRFALQPLERGQSGTGVGCLLPEIALSYEAIFITLNLDLNCACVYPKFMATTRFNVSCCFPASIRLGLKARTERISYPQALATPRHHLVRIRNKDRTLVVNAEMAGGEAPKRSYPEKSKGFIEEMKYVAMRMHPKDQAKEGKREYKDPQDGPIATWKFTLEGYLMFLVENKLVFDTLERIIHDSTVPTYAAFKNTGLERAETLGRDLEWFKEQGYEIPEPMANCKTYSQYLKAIAENDPPAFICHFYNIYFAHSAGGRKIGTLVSKRILDNKELEFYKWDGHVSELLKNVSEELNKVSELWTREEKNHCLEETEKAFKLYGEIFRSLVS